MVNPDWKEEVVSEHLGEKQRARERRERKKRDKRGFSKTLPKKYGKKK